MSNGGSFDAIITNGMASIRSAADAAGKSLSRMRQGIGGLGSAGDKEFKKIGEAVQKMGGPMAEIGGKFFGSAGMQGGMRMLALTMAAAGVGMKVFSDVIRVAEIRAQALASALADVRSAAAGAAQARQSFAAGSEGTGRLTAHAEALFGKDAASRAAVVAKNYGGSQEDALKAMVASRKIDPRYRGQAVEIAARVGATSETGAEEIMALLSDPAKLAQVLNAPKSIGGVGLQGNLGQAAMALMLARGGQGAGHFRSALNAIGGSSEGARARIKGMDQAKDIVTGAQVDAFTSGATEITARQAASDAVNPEAAAMRDWWSKVQESQRRLSDLAEATPNIVRLFQRYRPGGDAEIQAMREMNAAAQAVTGTQTP